MDFYSSGEGHFLEQTTYSWKFLDINILNRHVRGRSIERDSLAEVTFNDDVHDDFKISNAKRLQGTNDARTS